MSEIEQINFFVPGLAKTSGSKRAFYNKKLGRSMIVPANPKQKDWQASVGWYARQEFQGQAPWDGPIRMFILTQKNLIPILTQILTNERW